MTVYELMTKLAEKRAGYEVLVSVEENDDRPLIETDIAGQPADVWFNVRLHCS